MFEYDDIKINYKEVGSKRKDSLIFLHGWGQNINMMEPLAKSFYEDYHVLILDLPGFGLSEEPKKVWLLSDYVEMLYSLVQKLKLKNITIIGHSFGGKIALLYALSHPVEKLVLLASPYKKRMKELTNKQKILKIISKVPVLSLFADFAKKHIGSTDYRNSSPMMREILVKHINTDISNEIKKIKCPTLIIWGTKDEAVSYEDGQELEKIIPGSGLVTYEGCTHYAYLERLNQTINVLKSFLN